ncbi:hypothetical protein FF098_015540 [Parvularcula flava]|uniref:Uncharacterized protein n=1 Tax=Aquisalinus luteolus TaxID=1566827 RepID=A0A8J3ES21_9PROT|nr:hypothetical protein [Aquisalinus luteolus]NHK29330.1 hypothetical protein [Aquisalinus luteolus]GGI01108.1 hypothetical protein GCM10011355_30970 [Aquisalinus luteolus]
MKSALTPIFAAMAALALTILPGTASAQSSDIYDGNAGGLQGGWQDWSWAEIEMQSPVGGEIYPIKITADEWEALQLGRQDKVMVPEGLTLDFYINGGTGGGQRIAVQFANVDEQIGETYVIELKATTWSPVSINLDEIGVSGKKFNIIRVICQQQSACAPFYVDKMFFGSPAAE